MAAFGGGNPFASGGNPFGGGGLKGGLGMLKKKAKPKAFVELEISVTREEQWKKNATTRMREIDSFRLHVPEAGERSQFSIPESTDRVNTQDQKHLMVLCGGYAGVRFSSEDLSLIRTSTQMLRDTFTSLDTYFKSLPSAVKRKSLPEDVIANSTLQEGADENKENDTADEEKGIEETEEEKETREQQAVVTFHRLADAVQEVLTDIQQLVKEKHTAFSAMKGSNNQENIVSNPLGQDGDGEGEESMQAKPRPLWLETLLNKYHREVINNNTDNTKMNTSNNNDNQSTTAVCPALPPLGSLCAFLSCCAVRLVPTSHAEDEALRELIQASSDHAAPCVGCLPDNIDDEIFSHTQKYWAQRFFVFMKKLSELKTAVKDEKSLLLFEKFYL